MARIIRDDKQPFPDTYVDLYVYRSVKDRSVIFGLWGFAAQKSLQGVEFFHSGYGVPIAKAYRDAEAFCEKHGIEGLLLIDPEGLFKAPQ